MRSSSAKTLLAVVAVLLLLDGAAVVRINRNQTRVAKWDDPNVAALARIAARERKLSFHHSVPVVYVATPEEFVQKVAGSASDLSAKARREYDTSGQEFKALGLIPGKADLYQLERSGLGRTALAVYSPEHQQILINSTYGGQLDEDTKVTLVHELTHVLQDQHFGLNRHFSNSLQGTVFHSLVEGDAVRVQTAYLQSLPAAKQQAYLERQVTLAKDAAADLGDYPNALRQFSAAPYNLGAALATLVADDKGVGALNGLFKNPPTSDEGLIDPFKVLENEGPVSVAAPPLKTGETLLEHGRFGALAWFVTLANFLDPRTALSAVDGWGGDAYTAYRAQNRPCMRIAFKGDTAKDTSEMHDALNQWQAVFHNGRVSVSAVGASVQLDACQPDVVPPSPATAKNSIALPTIRASIAAALRGRGMARKDVVCVTGAFVKEIDLGSLSGDTPDVSKFAGIAQRAVAACGVT